MGLLTLECKNVFYARKSCIVVKRLNQRGILTFFQKWVHLVPFVHTGYNLDDRVGTFYFISKQHLQVSQVYINDKVNC